MSETVGFWTKLCCIPKRLDGKIGIVTGCYIGAGLSIVGEVARRGATVIMASQDVDKAESVKIHLIEKYGVKNPDHLKTDISCKEIIPCLTPIEAHQLVIEVINFTSLMSIREFVKRIIETHNKLDFLINNANIKSVKKYTTTNDGFEMTMGVNYFSSFLLTQLLLPLLLKGTSSRIINVCFRNHQHNHVSRPNLQMNQSNYSPIDAYYHSQLANIMYTLELSEYLKHTDIMVVSAYAGFFKGGNNKSFKSFINKIANFLITPIFPSQWEMAQTVLYTVLTDNLVSETVKRVNGFGTEPVK
ncbi:unnamed protein product [Trichobilharzia szidati]|nr:unnamed protein product [Trichobilharzia szidati]